MSTDRQRFANQQNARKSTGPKSTEGKDNSRRNALKHGLAGEGKVLRRNDDRKLQKTLKAWREHLLPIDVLEDCLVMRAALATVRLERCVKHDLADVARRRRRAKKRWEQRQRRFVSLCVDRLPDNPADAVAQLESSSFGCDWLVEQWQDLKKALDEPGSWDDDEAALAIRLLGKDPATAPMDDSSLTKLRLATLAASPEFDLDEADAFFEQSTADLDPESRLQALSRRLPDPETGRAMLLEIVDDEVARLEPLRAELWEEQDAPARQEAEDLALVDSSTEGARSLRYETANEMSLHRNLNQLVRLRKIEPEQQTINRWSKAGVEQGRVWRGTGWEYIRADGRSSEEFDDAQSEATGEGSATASEFGGGAPVTESAIHHRADERSAEGVSGALGTPESSHSTVPESGPSPSLRASAPRGRGVCATDGARARNEANFSGANGDRHSGYDNRAPGSPTASKAVSAAALGAHAAERRAVLEP